MLTLPPLTVAGRVISPVRSVGQLRTTFHTQIPQTKAVSGIRALVHGSRNRKDAESCDVPKQNSCGSGVCAADAHDRSEWRYQQDQQINDPGASIDDSRATAYAGHR